MRVDAYTTFLDYLKKELSSFRHFEAHFAAQSFESIGRIVQIIYANPTKIRAELISTTKEEFINCDEDSILRSIELALRLCLTVNIRSSGVTVGPTPPHHSWGHNLSSQALLDGAIFQKSERQLSEKECRIDQEFTAKYLMHVSGVKILWIDNLGEHLRFSHRSRTLKVYQHKICLLHHLNTPNCILPVNLVEETIDTLNLLFPPYDPPTNKFLCKEKKRFNNLGLCGRDPVTDLRKYSYWRNELYDLIQVFEEPPQQWWQLWRYRRNKAEFAQFWIAVLVGIFTMITIPTSIISAYYTFQQADIARIQACASESWPQGLENYCKKR